ncbi:L,D-transpeptidase [Streptomyces sp. NPDC047017]|uniref:L,D-transpeptidase n=1 Tax=Streptomyces sp. NPDC047017 TaxID=3155024 RepID=UPI0033E54B6B
MSDQPPPHPLTAADLSSRLRGLAEHGETAAPATGAQVRGRAARRRRGRRAVLSTGALAAAAVTTVAAVTTGALGSSHKPAAPQASPSPAPVQRVTVDLDAHTLTVEGHRFTIGAPVSFCPIGETTVTVTAKYPVVNLRPSEQHVGRAGPRKWAVTFTDRGHRQRLLLFAMETSDLPALGKDGILGAVALAPADGKRVYDIIRPGARVEFTGRQAARTTASDAACIDRQPVTGGH